MRDLLRWPFAERKQMSKNVVAKLKAAREKLEQLEQLKELEAEDPVNFAWESELGDAPHHS